VVSLPHGWGHGRPGTRTQVANAHAGVSANDVTDTGFVDLLSGTARGEFIETHDLVYQDVVTDAHHIPAASIVHDKIDVGNAAAQRLRIDRPLPAG
jgi:hypothetical protein